MEDIATSLYPAVDWSRCLVAGSYALQQYTRDKSWMPGDIDIVCQCDSYAEFDQALEAFAANLGPSAAIIKAKHWTPEARAKEPIEGEERFHESIIGTSTLKVAGVPLPVQLVGITSAGYHLPGDNHPSILTHMARITDLPAKVTYSVHDQGRQRIFHVPETAIAALMTRRIPRGGTCASRVAKYRARGYTFDE